ncbi:cytochrome c oxidase-like protein [Cercophora newfieldiana]|uniref:Cytochrome c oxidase-like protein n=1 Tax=Cercophora newfieldiana TaxID=92897 RepID=A0AA39YQB0_9PEZI|nr:cytochrome c oxidase-like protein [Cercophora newfieldiana]
MPQPVAPMRPIINALSRASTRKCARLMSTARSSQHPRRSLPQYLSKAQAHQPLIQRRTFKTVEEAKSRYRSGPFSWKAGILFVLTGGGLLYYFEREKERMQAKRIADSQKGVGAPKVGGPFQLIDQDGKTVTEQDLRGRYSLVYFGFTHCPDICPEELDKMARMFDVVQAEQPDGLLPVFVTCDPVRDGPKELKEYLAEFHPSFVGLTGTYDQIKAMCKAYRVYFSTPSQVKPGQDYLVDHSIYFYLMDPEGDFVEALGRQHSPDQAAQIILGHMKEWKGPLKKN